MQTWRWLVLSCLVALGGTASAQEFRATLNGTVTDGQEARIPGASIEVTSASTGARFTTVTSASGQYSIPLLPPDAYKVVVSSPGFKRYVREGVQLSTNEHVTLDITMELGAVADSVTVTADAPLLSTSSASVGQAITVRHVDTMPMSGRAPMMLAQLSIGVASATNPQANSRPFDNDGTSSISMGGSLNKASEILLDGGPNMAKNRRTGYNPPLDSVAEVKVEVFQPDAAYGDTDGGTINVVTRGGTNQFHGTAGWYNQVSNLAATPFYTNRVGGKKGFTLYNQWGFTAGAPVIIPKVYNAKNKIFWYFAYDAIKHSVLQPYTLTVPTAAEKAGDFSALLGLNSSYTIYDPATGVAQAGGRRQRLPFPGNVIPAARFNPTAVNYLKYYPAPNQIGSGDGTNNYLANTIRHDDYFTVLERVDFNFSAKHKLFSRYQAFYRTEHIRQYFDNPSTGEYNPRDVNGAIVDDVFTLSPTMVLDTRLNWNRFVDMFRPQSAGFDIKSIGYPASLAARSPYAVMPRVTLSDAYQTLGFNGASKTPFDNFQLFTTLNKSMGAHSLKLGVDIRSQRESAIAYGYSTGSYTFGTNWTRGPLDNSTGAPIGQGLASLLLGLPTAGQFDLNGTRTNSVRYYSVFFQDDWRVNNSLTVNVGLRYEKETGIVERYNRALVGFDFASANMVTAAAKAAYAAAPIPEVPVSQFNPAGGPIYASAKNRNVYSTESNGFSPRFGFAWKPPALAGKTVIRGGLGVYFQPYGAGTVYQPGFSQSTPLVATNDGYLTPYATLSSPFPDGLVEPPGAANGINTYLGQSITFNTPQEGWPYAMRWTATVQQQLANNLLLEVGYMGTRTLHIPINRDINYVPAQFLSTSAFRDNTVINRLTANVVNPFQNLLPGTNLNGSTITVQQLLLPHPQLSGLTIAGVNDGYSDYHALDVRLEKRFASGVQFLASTTWSKMMEATSRLNPSDASVYRQISTNDRPYRFVLSGAYDLPFGRNKLVGGNATKPVNAIIGGWSVSEIFTVQGGAPLSWGNVIYLGGDLNYNPRQIDGAFSKTPFNTISSQQLASNIRVFPQRFSNLRAERINNLDVALIKNIPVFEKLNVQFRAESFNTLNHTQFSTPSLSPTSSDFSKVTAQANWPRVIQATLRLVW